MFEAKNANLSFCSRNADQIILFIQLLHCVDMRALQTVQEKTKEYIRQVYVS